MLLCRLKNITVSGLLFWICYIRKQSARRFRRLARLIAAPKLLRVVVYYSTSLARLDNLWGCLPGDIRYEQADLVTSAMY